jgi:hypothetical protein
MAISAKRALSRRTAPQAFAVETASRRSANALLVQTLGRLGRELLGLIILLTGVAMLFTLWLIPLGLPLALVGLAVLTCPRGS